MANDLFEGLPRPSANLPPPSSELQLRQPPPEPPKPRKTASFSCDSSSSSSPAPAPAPPLPPAAAPKPIIKPALKRPKPAESIPEETVPEKKRLMFKTMTDASEQQVIEAMQKIASHIKTPAKFSKASNVKAETSDYLFSILEAAMASPTACTDPSMRADYHALFSAAHASERLSKKQKNQLTTWTIRVVMAIELFTNDSFLFSKAAGRLKEAISNLPVVTEDDDREEAAVLEDDTNLANEDDPTKQDVTSAAPAENNDEESDPFGLDAFLTPASTKKYDKTKGKTDNMITREEEETKRFLRSKREALVLCLEIAARRYKTPWCQTVIDILAKHAFDDIARFTSKQRSAIEKLWASIREQHNHIKQGKSVTGKLDVNAFEWLQQKYATEKISIRHSVGNSGDRKTEMWLG
ncbi:unnamed protein product [Malus baccata var. baccata]